MEKKKKVAAFIPMYLFTLCSGYFFYQRASSGIYDWRFYAGLFSFLLIASVFIWFTVRIMKRKIN